MNETSQDLNLFQSFLAALKQLAPLLAVIAVFIAMVWFVDRLLKKNKRLGRAEGDFSRHLIMLGVTAIGILLCILTLPVEENIQHDLLTVFGLVLTAIITLSSTTFASNALAGLMLRTINHFRPGDFIRVEEHFGRVTERGLFHTEIQTEDRDLAGIPNMFLVQHPVTVVHETGTMISATVSLGYDVPVDVIEKHLLAAGEKAGLEEPFIRVHELGDFSVTYRVTGFLKNIKTLLGTRSRLRREMLNSLHREGIEIASPSIMIQRPIKQSDRIIPTEVVESPSTQPSHTSETKMFDKAEKAGKLEDLKELHEELNARIKEIDKQLSEADEDQRQHLEQERERVKKRMTGLESAWENIEKKLDSE